MVNLNGFIPKDPTKLNIFGKISKAGVIRYNDQYMNKWQQNNRVKKFRAKNGLNVHMKLTKFND